MLHDTFNHIGMVRQDAPCLTWDSKLWKSDRTISDNPPEKRTKGARNFTKRQTENPQPSTELIQTERIVNGMIGIPVHAARLQLLP